MSANHGFLNSYILIMNSKNNSFKLLMLYQSHNDAETIISLFRNTGHTARAKKLNTEVDLRQAVQQQSWDLFISDNNHPELSIEQALAIIHADTSHAKTPSILILPQNCSDEELEYALTLGISDIICGNNQQHFLHSALREIKHHREQLSHQKVLAQFHEVQSRYELLLENSKDAIAYITDGMHIHANQAYSELFGYSDSDEFDCLPVIDLISYDSQASFKSFLKRYNDDAGKHNTITLTAVKEDQTNFDVSMELSASIYEEEACTQILIRHTGEQLASVNKEHKAGDSALTALQATLDRVQSSHNKSSAALLLFDLQDIQAEIGYQNSQDLIDLFIEFSAKHGHTAMRHGDYSLVLSDNIAAKALGAKIDKLIDDSRNAIFELAGKTFSLSVCAGICAIESRTNNHPQEIIDHCFQASIEAKNKGQHCVVYQPPSIEVNSQIQGIKLEDFTLNGGIKILYQPIVSLRGDTGEYYETSYTLENSFSLTASGFFQDNESKLDRWVIMQVTRALAEQRKQKGKDTRLLINLSPTALKDNALGDWLGLILKAANLPAKALVIQVEEKTVREAVTACQQFFKVLDKHGIRYSVSHFNHDSNILKHINCHFVRINCKIATHSVEQEREKLKQTLRKLANRDIGTIIPEVNLASMLTTLWQIGVGYIQGDYLQGPEEKMNYKFTDLT